MDDDQQFCLRWNNHQSTLISVFDTLLEKGIHVDCTLAAEGQTLKAHKVVLSACSPYFEAVLSQQYDKHPIIILKDVKFAELRAMMDYMYRGEVNISQDQLGALLKAAESLQIKGLSDSKPPAPPPPVTHTTVPRAVSPPPKVSPGSPCAEERSREGSLSPLRRKRKKRRASLSPVPPPAIIPPALPLLLNNNPATPPDDCMAKLKLLQPEQAAAPASPAPAPSLEPATLEPKADEDQPTEDEGDSEGEHAGTSHSLQDSTGFSWHLDRSQDEMSLGTDGQRDTTAEDMSFTRIGGLTWEQWSARLALPVMAGLREAASPGGGFACSDCGRVYKLKSSLRNHQKWECGKEPQFQCPHCVYRAKQKMHIARHMERMHREKVYLKPDAALRPDNIDACT